MSYVKAENVLPKELIDELQKYVQGKTIYIPKTQNNYQKWGTCSGGRKVIDERNASMRNDFSTGFTINQLADKYFLSPETVKKIVYSRE